MTFFDTNPLTTRFGVEINNLDVRRLDSKSFSHLYDVWLKWKVLVIRDQSLTPADLVKFASRFGEALPDRFVAPHCTEPSLMEITRPAGAPGRNFGGMWHTDVSYLDAPAKATVLYAVTLPSRGGDTLFIDLEAALEGLSPTMQQMLTGLRASHLALGPLQRKRLENKDYTPDLNGETQVIQALHPLVRTHPETDNKCLFVNGSYLHLIEGMTAEESLPILDFLRLHAQRPAFSCRVRWEPGTITLWDNRCTQHKALDDYHERREMLRYTVRGSIPRGSQQFSAIQPERGEKYV